MALKLSSEQKARLREISDSIEEDKVTVGFSVETRDPTGTKKWCMVTRTVDLRGKQFTPEESRIVSCVLSKRVTSEVLRDAVARGAMNQVEARAELESAFRKYDADIARFLGNSKVQGDEQ